VVWYRPATAGLNWEASENRCYRPPVLLLTAVVALAAPPPAELSPRQLAILETINASGPQIDACVARYVEEQPGAKGLAKVQIRADAEGRVDAARVTTELPQARTLRACLARVARSWRLPPPAEDHARLELAVPVYAGAAFRIPKPGEAKKPESKDDEEPPPPKWFNPASAGFLPSGW